ncbi:MAG: hypothetical protein NWF02_06935 [Candidatus Bathyarchaeota archaeon]|nr:hypothetical protein [Candidatus Bathyarchaeum sp.]
MYNAKRLISVICLLLIFAVFIFPDYTVEAEKDTNSIPVYLLEMPEEYINYTISQVNGSLWAKVDGTYPLNKINIGTQSHSMLTNQTLPTLTGEMLSMMYPTPPSTKNISIKISETELEWSNYTQTFPEAVHYTAVGNWPMISCNLDPVLEDFTLKIHYEHPIEQKNGSYMFLYDINIIPYLSPWSNKSTAYFTIKFETEITDFQPVTITPEGIMKSVNYTTHENSANVLLLQVVSEYSKPLMGDLLISFSDSEKAENDSSEHSDSNVQLDQISIILAVGSSAVLALMGYWLVKQNNGDDKNS